MYGYLCMATGETSVDTFAIFEYTPKNTIVAHHRTNVAMMTLSLGLVLHFVSKSISPAKKKPSTTLSY